MAKKDESTFQMPDPAKTADESRVSAPRGIKICPACRAEYRHDGDDCGADDNKHIAWREDQ